MQDMMLERMLRGLKLTKEQQAEVKDIRADSKEEGLGIQHQVMGLTRELNNLVMKEVGPEDIMEVAGKLGKAMGDQAVQKVVTAKKIKAVLTDEQKEKLEGMQVKMRERMEQMHEQEMESIFSELVLRVKDAITEAATLAGDAGMPELTSEPILADVSKRAEMIRKGMIQFL